MHVLELLVLLFCSLYQLLRSKYSATTLRIPRIILKLRCCDIALNLVTTWSTVPDDNSTCNLLSIFYVGLIVVCWNFSVVLLSFLFRSVLVLVLIAISCKFVTTRCCGSILSCIYRLRLLIFVSFHG